MQQWLASLDLPKPADPESRIRLRQINRIYDRPLSSEEADELEGIRQRQENAFLNKELPLVVKEIVADFPRIPVRTWFDLESFYRSKNDDLKEPVYGSRAERTKFTFEMKERFKDGLNKGDLLIVAAAVHGKSTQLETNIDAMRSGINQTIRSPNNPYNPSSERDRKELKERLGALEEEASRVDTLDKILQQRTGLRIDFDWNELLGEGATKKAA